MPFGGLLSIAGAGASLAGGLGGLFGGTPTQNVPNYSYGNMAGADSQAYQGIGNLGQYNVAAQTLPQYQQIVQQGVNNPYAAGYQQNANQVGQAGMQSGAGITGTALNQLGGVNSLMSMGFDPQNALYSQLQNQNQQQNLAMLGQSGVAGTPYGQGVAGQQNTNFNIDWQNQQLGRASQAAGAAGGLLNSIGSATSTGLGQMQQGAALPYQTAQGITGNQLNLLGQGGQFGQMAQQGQQQQIQDYLAYLQGGTGQQNANVNQANSTFGQQQTLGGQVGQGLAGLAKGWGNFGGSNAGTPQSSVGTFGWSPSSAGQTNSPFYGPVQ